MFIYIYVQRILYMLAVPTYMIYTYRAIDLYRYIGIILTYFEIIRLNRVFVVVLYLQNK